MATMGCYNSMVDLSAVFNALYKVSLSGQLLTRGGGRGGGGGGGGRSSGLSRSFKMLV